jgi:hypothetical protein
VVVRGSRRHRIRSCMSDSRELARRKYRKVLSVPVIRHEVSYSWSLWQCRCSCHGFGDAFGRPACRHHLYRSSLLVLEKNRAVLPMSSMPCFNSLLPSMMVVSLVWRVRSRYERRACERSCGGLGRGKKATHGESKLKDSRRRTSSVLSACR